jgi:hypothetical protein
MQEHRGGDKRYCGCKKAAFELLEAEGRYRRDQNRAY